MKYILTFAFESPTPEAAQAIAQHLNDSAAFPGSPETFFLFQHLGETPGGPNDPQTLERWKGAGANVAYSMARAFGYKGQGAGAVYTGRRPVDAGKEAPTPENVAPEGSTAAPA